MPELTAARRRLVLAICCMSLLIVSMDVTIVNVALPAIGRDLGASLSGLQWTVDAYTLVLASLLIFSGSTADRLGRRRVFQVGLATFTAASLLCSLAPGLPALVAFRMVQAVGGSMLNPVAMSIITNVFVEPRERARAIGVWGGVVGISLGLGPVVGGLLVESVGWRGIFWINVPIGLAAMALTARFVPESKAAVARRPDAVGQLLAMVALASLTYAIIEAPRLGWLAMSTLLLGGVALVAGAAFVHYERASGRTAARAAVLPQCAVLWGNSHRGLRLRWVRRVPVPEHPLPAGRAGIHRAPRGVADAPAGRDHVDRGAVVRAGSSARAAPGCRWCWLASPWARGR